ncbi:hypothetical protein [Nocardia arthritidis]|uniref:Uncharacterized protein n=1 Tax=Nocardia arthritidis TaxID=228602 RepID=A0A6G9Y555_9NOCA|nr:hypothetical protein [Nocardia arthritidis]QIS08203.1 hypothetical protein F5544_01400 [Nocardia arthritidis]
MSDALRTTTTRDGSKAAVWQMIGRAPYIVNMRLFRPGPVMFSVRTDLAEARQAMPEHEDLWNAVRHDYWADLLYLVPIREPSG